MKTLTLKYLKVKNFAGISKDIYFEHSFGNDVSLSGQNGTGKTSIGNSISWLLTGKDLEGRSEFGIKPKDPATKEVIHNLETSVEATFTLKGESEIGYAFPGQCFDYNLKRCMIERWETFKGGEKHLKGHEFFTSINETGVPDKEFKDFIGSQFEGQVLPLLITPHAFNNLHWKVRRELLFDMIDLPTDYDLAEKHWKALAKQLEDNDLDGVQKQMKKELKEAKDKIWEYTIRLDEWWVNSSSTALAERTDRVKNLKQQAEIYQRKKGACQEIIDQIEELLSHKAEIIKINLSKLFPEVEFKMFEEQLNGELKPTCETMWHGRTWSELSAGERISVGLRIVQSLQRHYQFKAPVIIDEHESVAGTKELPLPGLDAQTIRLYHVPEKELEVKYE